MKENEAFFEENFYARGEEILGKVKYESSKRERTPEEIQKLKDKKLKLEQYVGEIKDMIKNYKTRGVKFFDASKVSPNYNEDRYLLGLLSYKILKAKIDVQDEEYLDIMAKELVRFFILSVIKNNPIRDTVNEVAKSEKFKNEHFDEYSELLRINDIKLNCIGLIDMANHFTDLNESGHVAFYDNFDNSININMCSQILSNAINEGNFAYILSIVGHEYYHGVQEHIKAIPIESISDENVKAKFESMVRDLDKLDDRSAEKEEIETTLLALMPNNAEDMTPKKLKEMVTGISYFRYFKAEHEIEARDYSTIFAENILDGMSNALVFESDKKLVEEDKQRLTDIREQDKVYSDNIYKNYEGLYHKYNKTLADLSSEDLYQFLVDDISEESLKKTGEKEGMSPEMAYCTIMQKRTMVAYQILKSKDAKELQIIVDYALDNHSSFMLTMISQYASDYQDTNLEQYISDKVANGYLNMPLNGNFNVPYKVLSNMGSSCSNEVLDKLYESGNIGAFVSILMTTPPDKKVMYIKDYCDELTQIVDDFLNDEDIKAHFMVSSQGIDFIEISNIVNTIEDLIFYGNINADEDFAKSWSERQDKVMALDREVDYGKKVSSKKQNYFNDEMSYFIRYSDIKKTDNYEVTKYDFSNDLCR